MKVKVGIFFGGTPKDQERSFAGGRTVFNALNKQLFEAIPIFVDQDNNFFLLHWPLIHKEEIKDFFPLNENWDQLNLEQQTAIIATVGKRLAPLELPQLINIAFLTLHDYAGRPGDLQRQLDELQIPYTGCNGQAIEASTDSMRLLELSGAQSAPLSGTAFSVLAIQQEDETTVAIPDANTLAALSGLQVAAIRQESERVFSKLNLQAFAQIEGIIAEDASVLINRIDTAPSFASGATIYQQAADIGLNPSQLLTFALNISLRSRVKEQPDIPAYKALFKEINAQIASLPPLDSKKRIGVIFGGYPQSHALSLKSSRTIIESLSSSEIYQPIPYLLLGEESYFQVFQVPSRLMASGSVDQLTSRLSEKPTDILKRVQDLCEETTQKYGSGKIETPAQQVSFATLAQSVQVVFIALNGRPGEDGKLQEVLEKHQIPYTGSDVLSSNITIDKFKTLQILERNRFDVPYQKLVKKERFQSDPDFFYETIESDFPYPFIAKPVDSGSGAAVKLIHSKPELEDYVNQMFGEDNGSSDLDFPLKDEILIESQITAKEAAYFLEITGHILTRYKEDGLLNYEVFELSEFKPDLSKFLSPARFSDDEKIQKAATEQVKKDLENAARVLNLQGYAQIDAFVRIYNKSHIETVIFEVNALPLITSTSPIVQQAALSNYPTSELLDDILNFSMQKYQANKPVVEPQTPPAEPTEVEEEEPIQEEALVAPSTSPPMTNPFTPPQPQPEFEPEFEPESEPESQSQSAPHPHSPTPTSLVGKLKAFFKNLALTIWSFLKSSAFLKNFGALLAVLIIFFFLFRGWLQMYTHHDESLTVHDYIGMPFDEAKKKAREQSFKLVVIDSAFGPDYLPYEIYQQDPSPMSRVKEKRTIYVSVYHRSARDVTLPSLVGNYDFEQYKKKLKRKRIDAVVKERVFDARQEENTILHFFYNDQKITQDDVKKGFKVPEGSVLEFVVTERQTGFVPIPSLVCQRYKAAAFLITSNNLNIGTIHGDVLDQDNAYVWKQDPPYESGQMIQMGRQIDIYLSDIRPAGCPEE